MWALLVLISFLVCAGSIIALPFVKGRRKKAAALAAVSFVIMVVASQKFNPEVPEQAKSGTQSVVNEQPKVALAALPPAETLFVAAVEKGRRAFAAGANDMANDRRRSAAEDVE